MTLRNKKDKDMETPERIWIDPLIDLLKLNGHINNDSIEYTRADAFIKKACEWLTYNNDLIDGDVPDYVESFKNYMKGE